MTVLRTSRQQDQPWTFARPGFIAVEGQDDQDVVARIIEDLSDGNSVHVHDMQGKDGWGELFRVIAIDPYFRRNVRVVGLVRDCDDSPSSALQSCVQLLANTAGVSAPVVSGEFARDERTVSAIHLIPSAAESGALEDLVLPSLDPGRVQCAETYLECVQGLGHAVPRPGKAKVFSYLAMLERPRHYLSNIVKTIDITHPAFTELRTFCRDFLGEVDRSSPAQPPETPAAP